MKFIRQEFGDYFCIAVAGYPEGHLEAESLEKDMVALKEKVDAGADMVVTQLFYDNQEFISFVHKMRELGVPEHIPIIPGMMPIQSYQGFKKMTEFCKTKVPEEIFEQLEPIKDNDQEVKDFGRIL